MYSMITAKQYVQSGDYKNILVVGADKLSKITDLTDRSTAVLLVMAHAVVIESFRDEGIVVMKWDLMVTVENTYT